MALAEGSGKAAIKDQQDVGLVLEGGQGNMFPQKILKGKIRGRGMDGYFGHSDSFYLFDYEEKK